jgi:hypothetical protein
VPWMTKLDDGMRKAIAGPDMVLSRSTAGLPRLIGTQINPTLVQARSLRTASSASQFRLSGAFPAHENTRDILGS